MSWDNTTGQQIWSHPFGSCLSPPIVVVLPDSQSFLANRIEEGSRRNNAWRYAALYETKTGNKIADLPDADGIAKADISFDGRWLASIIWKGTQFQIWDLQAKRGILKALPKGWKRTADCVLNRIRLSPDNHWLVIGCDARGDMAVYQWGEENSPKR
jgi:hypothetical protein